MAARAWRPQPKQWGPRDGKALRWVDGVGTCLAPCSVLRRTGPDWESDENRGYLVRFEDGVEKQLHSDYVLVSAHA